MQIRGGNTYRNKKTGNLYHVVTTATHTENMEGMVVYARSDNWLDKILIRIAAIALKLIYTVVWVRPVDLFKEKFTEK